MIPLTVAPAGHVAQRPGTDIEHTCFSRARNPDTEPTAERARCTDPCRTTGGSGTEVGRNADQRPGRPVAGSAGAASSRTTPRSKRRRRVCRSGSSASVEVAWGRSSMLQPCGRSSARQELSSYVGASAPSVSPRRTCHAGTVPLRHPRRLSCARGRTGGGRWSGRAVLRSVPPSRRTAGRYWSGPTFSRKVCSNPSMSTMRRQAVLRLWFSWNGPVGRDTAPRGNACTRAASWREASGVRGAAWAVGPFGTRRPDCSPVQDRRRHHPHLEPHRPRHLGPKDAPARQRPDPDSTRHALQGARQRGGGLGRLYGFVAANGRGVAGNCGVTRPRSSRWGR